MLSTENERLHYELQSMSERLKSTSLTYESNLLLLSTDNERLHKESHSQSSECQRLGKDLMELQRQSSNYSSEV